MLSPTTDTVPAASLPPMPREDWIEHRRTDDRELLGWIRPEGEAWVAVDRLGRDATARVDWPEAEEALDARGLHWLADLWQLTLDDGSVRRVRFAEVSPNRVVVVEDHFGAAVPGAATFNAAVPGACGAAPVRG